MSGRKAFALLTSTGVTAVAVVLMCSRGGVLDPRFASAGATIVQAEKSGLRFNTQALSGRVGLVASRPGMRWRILGVTAWRRATGRLLTGRFDTTSLPDGRYDLQLVDGRSERTQLLTVRNYTYLHPTMEGRDDEAPDNRSSDARAVVGVFTRRSYRPGETAVLNLWHRYSSLRIELLHVGPEDQLTSETRRWRASSVGRSASRRSATHGSVRIHIGDWESGVYAARMTSGARSASHRSSSGRGVSGRNLSRWSSRPIRGRPTTTATPTETASRTLGTTGGTSARPSIAAPVPRPRRAAEVPAQRRHLPALARAHGRARSTCSPRTTSSASPATGSRSCTA